MEEISRCGQTMGITSPDTRNSYCSLGPSVSSRFSRRIHLTEKSAVTCFLCPTSNGGPQHTTLCPTAGADPMPMDRISVKQSCEVDVGSRRKCT